MLNLQCQPATRDEVKEIILKNHYAHRMPMIQHAFKLVQDDEIVGVLTFGIPASHALMIGVAGEENAKFVLELNRLWTVDSLPKNALSWFVSKALKQIGNKIVVSYSDTGMHHNGYIYQATNFSFTGQTKLRTDVYTGKGKHSRHYDKNKLDVRIVRTPKNRYIIVVGDKQFKRSKRKSIKYDTLPYPKSKNEEYHIGDEKPELIFDRRSQTIEDVLNQNNNS